MEHGNESNAGREDQPPDSSAMRKQATKARAMGGLRGRGSAGKYTSDRKCEVAEATARAMQPRRQFGLVGTQVLCSAAVE